MSKLEEKVKPHPRRRGKEKRRKGKKNMKRIILAVGIIPIMLLVGGCVASVEIPHDPKIALVEYSVDGEIWHSLREDEVIRVDASVIKIRRTEAGSALPFGAVSDLRKPKLSGTLTKDSDSQVIVAEGKGSFLIKVNGSFYARIVME